MGQSVLAWAAIAVCGVALILSCVAVGVRSWVFYEEYGLTIHSGLWKRCVEISDTETCSDIESDDLATDGQYRGLKATRAFVILGVIVLPGAVVVGFLVLFVMKDKKILFFAAAVCACVAGFFHMIGISVFVGEVMDHKSMDDYEYGTGFTLTIVAWITAWISGGLFVAAKMMDTD